MSARTAALSPFMTASATSLLAALRPATIIKDVNKDITVEAMIRFRLIVVLLWGGPYQVRRRPPGLVRPGLLLKLNLQVHQPPRAVALAVLVDVVQIEDAQQQI